MLEIQFNVPGQACQTRRLVLGEYTIGRSFGADIRLKHESVARRHALLSIEDGQTFIRDLGAADSIRRNGVVLSQIAPVRRGDRFAIGDCELKIIDSPMDDTHEVPSSVEPADDQSTVILLAARAATPSNEPAIKPGSTELQALQEQLQALVLRELDLFRRTALNNLANADLRKEARQAIESIIASGAIQLPPRYRSRPVRAGDDGRDHGLRPDRTVPRRRLGVGSHGQWSEPDLHRAQRPPDAVPARFINDDSLMRVIERIVSPLGRRIDEGVPMVDARLPDGSRVNAIIPPLSLVGPILTIRKFAKQRFSMDRLVEIGALTRADG